VVLQLADQLLAAGMARGQDHERLHDLAPVRFGPADDGGETTHVLDQIK
jgi:hypothetical protein